MNEITGSKALSAPNDKNSDLRDDYDIVLSALRDPETWRDNKNHDFRFSDPEYANRIHGAAQVEYDCIDGDDRRIESLLYVLKDIATRSPRTVTEDAFPVILRIIETEKSNSWIVNAGIETLGPVFAAHSNSSFCRTALDAIILHINDSLVLDPNLYSPHSGSVGFSALKYIPVNEITPEMVVLACQRLDFICADDENIKGHLYPGCFDMPLNFLAHAALERPELIGHGAKKTIDFTRSQISALERLSSDQPDIIQLCGERRRLLDDTCNAGMQAPGARPVGLPECKA
jgi:hypothetical protein